MNMDTNPQQDQLFDCLAHHHRRIIIDVLRNSNTQKPTIELTHDVIERIRKTSDKEILSIEALQTSLYHSHLPKLKEAGLVEYDEERDLVAPNEYVSHLGILVDLAEQIAGECRQLDLEARDWDDEPIIG
ncbi:hypothetical protein [Natrinema sp. CBA1119]|uniref:DUF7344 domain-containing protein n=1 Tax=Natrinema sp. CBA1119 TaxID=1608465 RepID=UPI001145967A|nr:hypothetical protein [Natrinema sp. CBA1119]